LRRAVVELKARATGRAEETVRRPRTPAEAIRADMIVRFVVERGVGWWIVGGLGGGEERNKVDVDVDVDVAESLVMVPIGDVAGVVELRANATQGRGKPKF
jgi:hypothetical protein